MKNFAFSLVMAAACLASAAQAATVTATGATEIPKPATVTNDAPGSNDGILWFKESSGSTALANVTGLGGTGISAGDLVDTYMVFLNRAPGGSINTASASFTFTTSILGIFGQADGADLVATDYFGGTTTYTNFRARGIENNDNGTLTAGLNNDTLSITGTSQLDVFFKITQPGDWVRVATVSAVPLPAGALLLPLGLGALGLVRRRQRKAAA